MQGHVGMSLHLGHVVISVHLRDVVCASSPCCHVHLHLAMLIVGMWACKCIYTVSSRTKWCKMRARQGWSARAGRRTAG